jgi:DNA repair protein RadC
MSPAQQKVRHYHPRIKDWPTEERPREKLFKHGAEFLSEAELLAILIGSGINGITALDVAKRMLMDHHDLVQLSCCNFNELTRLKSIGFATAARLIACFEIGRRVEAGRSRLSKKMTCPSELAHYFQPQMRSLKKEVFKVVLLDSGNRLIKDVNITQGTLNASLVHPREVFKAAIDCLAAGIVLMHNHPSGDPFPSEQDKQITQQLRQAGQVMGIPVIDHLIIANNGYFSFANHRII